jgi:hypothetical protein
MSLPDEIVFLFDCDNTRLDNDRVQGRSLRTHLASEFGLSLYRKIRRPYGLPWCRRDASL